MHPSLVSENVRSFKRRGRSEADAVREAMAAAGQVDQSAGLQPLMRKMPLPQPGDGRITDPPVGAIASGPMLPNQPPDIPGVGSMMPHPGAPTASGPTIKPGFLPTDQPYGVAAAPGGVGQAARAPQAESVGGIASPMENMLLNRVLRPAVQPTRRMI